MLGTGLLQRAGGKLPLSFSHRTGKNLIRQKKSERRAVSFFPFCNLYLCIWAPTNKITCQYLMLSTYLQCCRNFSRLHEPFALKWKQSKVNTHAPDKTSYLQNILLGNGTAVPYTSRAWWPSGDLLTSAVDVLSAALGLTHAEPRSLGRGEVVRQADIKHRRGEWTVLCFRQKKER